MKTLLAILALMLAAPLCAKEELVTLPERDSVQLTIYNSEDLTLVRERRTLSFKQGNNRLQFSWANTLIDPTSVEFLPIGKEATDNLEIMDTSFPAESHEMLIWTVACTNPAGYEVEISYFTSGIYWSAEYAGMVNADETSVDLTAYVTVSNFSGEEYEEAEVRLVVGVVHLVERIVDLARPRYMDPPPAPAPPALDKEDMRRMSRAEKGAAEGEMEQPKEIQKAGLSEYYIYTVEGTETIPNSWSKRLKSFAVAGVPLKTVYRLEPDKFGWEFTKVLEFKNDEEHKLGKEPMPDGLLRLYKQMDGGRLGYMGQVLNKYIPKNEEVKVNVGPDAECTLKEKRLTCKKKDLAFRSNWLVGWTEVEEFEITVRNFRARDVEVEVHRTMAGMFTFESEDTWEKHDADTQKIHFMLKAGSERKLAFRITTKQGENAR